MPLILILLGWFVLASCNNKTRQDEVGKEQTVKKDTVVSIDGFWIDSSEVNSNEPRQYIFDTTKS